MKKYIGTLSVLLGVMICTLFTSGIVSAANFDISGTPTNGITVGGTHYTNSDIDANRKAVYDYIITYPQESAVIFFNANIATQNAILDAYNIGGNISPRILLEGAQRGLAAYLTGLNGYVTYSSMAVIPGGGGGGGGDGGNVIHNSTDLLVTKGTFMVEGIIGVVNDNGNYRLANGTRGNLATTPGITRYKILPPEGNGTWIYINALAPTVTLNNFTPSTIQVGQTSNISFTSTNANTCTGSGIWNGDLGGTRTNASGATTPVMNTPGTYSQIVTCTGNGGQATSATRTLTVTAVAAPEVTSFTASPTSIAPNQSSTLTWASTNADSCVITNNTSTDSATVPRAPSGTLTVFPTATTKYTIVCSRNSTNSSSKDATVTVSTTTTTPVVSSFTASPTSIAPNQSSTLTWASTNADKCTLGGVDKATSGTMTVSPTSTTTYNIVCSKGTVNSTAKSATVTVTAAGTPTVVSFIASPTSITAGQSATLTWASTGTDTNGCTINGVAGKPADSSMTVSPTSTTTYSIVCSKGTVNSTSKSVTITVTGTVSSTNPYARFLTAPTVTKLDTWVTTKIVARSSTLTATNYSKFIDGVITTFYKIKSETPTSNKNKRYMINYLIFSLQQIQDGINDEDDFLNGLL